jgi:hypothetical protein
MGPLFSNILFDQFERTRDGDRFYWLNQTYNSLENSLLNQGLGLTQIIELNSTASNIQQDPFAFASSIEGTLWFGFQGSGYVVVNAVVYLEDTSGNILATTLSDGFGDYFFDSLSSPSGGVSATGQYKVVVPAQGGFITTSSPGTQTITFGDQDVDDADFVLNFAVRSPPVASPAQIFAPVSGAHKNDSASQANSASSYLAVVSPPVRDTNAGCTSTVTGPGSNGSNDFVRNLHVSAGLSSGIESASNIFAPVKGELQDLR